MYTAQNLAGFTHRLEYQRREHRRGHPRVRAEDRLDLGQQHVGARSKAMRKKNEKQIKSN